MKEHAVHVLRDQETALTLEQRDRIETLLGRTEPDASKLAPKVGSPPCLNPTHVKFALSLLRSLGATKLDWIRIVGPKIKWILMSGALKDLKTLDENLVECLAMTDEMVYLPELESLEKDIAEKIVKKRQFQSEIATYLQDNFFAEKGDLTLGIRSLSEDVALVLKRYEGRIEFTRLQEVNLATAKILSEYRIFPSLDLEVYKQVTQAGSFLSEDQHTYLHYVLKTSLQKGISATEGLLDAKKVLNQDSLRIFPETPDLFKRQIQIHGENLYPFQAMAWYLESLGASRCDWFRLFDRNYFQDDWMTGVDLSKLKTLHPYLAEIIFTKDMDPLYIDLNGLEFLTADAAQYFKYLPRSFFGNKIQLKGLKRISEKLARTFSKLSCEIELDCPNFEASARSILYSCDNVHWATKSR